MSTDATTKPAVDTHAVSSWFDTLGLTRTGSLRFDRIGLGQSNLTYLVRDDAGHQWVLRRPPVGHTLDSAHDVVREARILRALNSTDVPAPRVLGVADVGIAGDSPIVLMEFVDGHVIDGEVALESLTPPLRRTTALSMVEALAQIHAVDLERAGLADIASHSPYAQRQLKRWTRQWYATWSGDNRDFDELTARLTAAIPAKQEICLVHGDFHLRNVITSPTTGTVRAVLDWELCTLGDPLADMGSTLAYWPRPGEIAFGHGLPALAGMPSHDEMAQAYLSATGRNGAALSFWYVLGLWKIAVIYAGIMRRTLDNPGNRSGIQSPDEAAVLSLLNSAADAAKEVGL
ncbi:phosphotransferase family protein [Nocardia sp. NPDC049220]|uniref:phosphotransferase family protein n=1 Tax=Nocardia sp. NPDC049220 TaxID=3155273 RepID=UPI0033D9338A